MEENRSFRPFLFATFFMSLGGWGGLALLVNYTLPTVWPRWAFFALLVVGVTGAALPITYLLNARFASREKPFPLAAVARQATWAGVFVAMLAWLLIGRVLNLTLAIWLGLGLVGIEILLRLRENSQPALPQPPRSPVSTPDDETP